METVFFWITWGLISFWALKTFYYSFSESKLDRLRKTSFGLNLAVVILTLLPWLPPNLNGKTGLDMAFGGNTFAMLFVILLVITTILFLTKKAVLLKYASGATIINTVVLFVLMYRLRPKTYNLTLYDVAPIVAMLLMLMNDVSVLLLWQQLDLRNNIKKSKSRIKK